MLTNGHVWYGYAAGEEVPTMPLRIERTNKPLHLPHRVLDALGYFVAEFRNRSDADYFVTMTAARYAAAKVPA